MLHLLALCLLLALPAAAGSTTWPDLSSPPEVSAGDGSKDAALVIGIEDYAFAPDIHGARANAVAWVQWLDKARGVSLVKPLLDAQATNDQILAAAREMAGRVQPGGTLWLIYIGHGAPSRTSNDGLLVGVDAQQTASSLESRSVPQDNLVAVINEALPADARAVLMLDACFSGRTAAGELVPGLAPFKPVSARVKASRITVLTAAGSDQYAGPLSDGRRPAFSYLVLGALRGWGDGARGGARDGTVTAAEAVAYADDALLQTVAGRSQTPTLDGDGGLALGQGRERGPDLTALGEASLHEHSSLPLGQDYNRLVEQAREAEEQRKRAEAEAAEAQKKLEDDRSARVATLRASVIAKASEDWNVLQPLLTIDSPEAASVVEDFANQYGAGIPIAVDGTRDTVIIKQANLARAWLARRSTSWSLFGTSSALVRLDAGWPLYLHVPLCADGKPPKAVLQLSQTNHYGHERPISTFDIGELTTVDDASSPCKKSGVVSWNGRDEVLRVAARQRMTSMDGHLILGGDDDIELQLPVLVTVTGDRGRFGDVAPYLLPMSSIGNKPSHPCPAYRTSIWIVGIAVVTGVSIDLANGFENTPVGTLIGSSVALLFPINAIPCIQRQGDLDFGAYHEDLRAWRRARDKRAAFAADRPSWVHEVNVTVELAEPDASQ